MNQQRWQEGRLGNEETGKSMVSSRSEPRIHGILHKEIKGSPAFWAKIPGMSQELYTSKLSQPPPNLA